MANKLKKKNKNPEKKTSQIRSKAFDAEKEEKIDWKALARDERTWKIIGAVFLLIALFLFISFISYFFTWKEDQDVAKQGFSAFLIMTKPSQTCWAALGQWFPIFLFIKVWYCLFADLHFLFCGGH